jgi:hypothetical protein
MPKSSKVSVSPPTCPSKLLKRDRARNSFSWPFFMSIVPFVPIRIMDILGKVTLQVLRLWYRGLVGDPRDLLDVLLLKLHGEKDLD